MSRTNCTAVLNSSVGPIPSEIGALTALTKLYLYENQLTGKISTTLYQNSIENHINREVTNTNFVIFCRGHRKCNYQNIATKPDALVSVFG